MQALEFISPVIQTVSLIANSYYLNGLPVVPTNTDLNRIQASVAKMSLVGKTIMVASGVGMLGSYIVWQLPLIGKPIGLMTGLVCIAGGVLGFDTFKAAENLNVFARRRVTNLTSNVLNSISSFFGGGNKEPTKIEFYRSMLATASQGTIILGTINNVITAKKPT